MKHCIRRHIYRDKITGMYYEKSWEAQPVQLIDGEGIPATTGVRLIPCDGAAYGLDTSALTPLWESGDGFSESVYGFAPLDFGQALFVTQAALSVRFDYLGERTRSEVLAEAKAHYEYERCDFSNRYWVARSYLRWLTSQPLAQIEVLAHVILAEYLKALSVDERSLLEDEFGTLALN